MGLPELRYSASVGAYYHHPRIEYPRPTYSGLALSILGGERAPNLFKSLHCSKIIQEPSLLHNSRAFIARWLSHHSRTFIVHWLLQYYSRTTLSRRGSCSFRGSYRSRGRYFSRGSTLISRGRCSLHLQEPSMTSELPD